MRRDDVLSADGLKFVIPAHGVAGISCSMLHARETALACKPVRALQGEIQRLYFAKVHLLNQRLTHTDRNKFTSAIGYPNCLSGINPFSKVSPDELQNSTSPR